MTVDIEQIKREVHEELGYPKHPISRVIDYLHSRGYLGGVPEWQPIETAPKDGSLFIAYWEGQVKPCNYNVTRRIENKHNDFMIWHKNSYRASTCFNPTHWMPLPAAPKGETK